MAVASPEAALADLRAHAVAQAAAADEQRLDLGLAFNLFPALYAHPSWLAQLGCAEPDDPAGAGLKASPSWLRALSAALLRHRALDRQFDCDFFDPAKRLALLNASTLTALAGAVCAALLRDRLRRVVESSEVRALHACIGVQAHQFAVRWPGTPPSLAPIVEGSEWPSAEIWKRRSVAQLFGAIPEHAIAVLGRLRLRFPCDWKLPDPRSPRLTEPQRLGLLRLVLAAVPEIAPQWTWLFAPAPDHAALGGAAAC